MKYDVIICGGGPAGASCAAFCATAGLKTLVLEKAVFPRDKVCGDCINPSCWPVLESLAIADRVLDLPHSKLAAVEFIGLDGRSISYPLTPSARGEIAIKRILFDQLLLQRAEECGAEIHQNTAVTAVASTNEGWKISTANGEYTGTHLIAADGRNSTVMRLLGILPSAAKERVSIQTHIPIPQGFTDRVTLRFLPGGYCGYNTVGGGELNLCLVSKPDGITALKKWAGENFGIAPDHSWRTISPISRDPVPASAENLLLVGDSARVVEPFTGEGIYYALASGELAAKYLSQRLSFPDYRRDHERLYTGRLWVNRISNYAALNPRIATMALNAMRLYPPALRFLTAKVVGTAISPETGR